MFEYASQFYAGTTSAGDVDQACLFTLFIVLADSLAAITDFPKPVVVALACTLRYLLASDIADSLSQATFFTKFTRHSEMHLTANTLANLEVFQNGTDYSI